jgi:hypothetical protein
VGTHGGFLDLSLLSREWKTGCLPSADAFKVWGQTGWLVTCANVGDSRAYVDAGGTPVQITADHRLVFNQAERHRLESMGRVVAPLSESSRPFLHAAGLLPQINQSQMKQLICNRQLLPNEQRCGQVRDFDISPRYMHATLFEHVSQSSISPH